MNNLLKVFKPEDINSFVFSILDQAYQQTIRDEWCTVVCDLESSDNAAPISKYIANVKQQLSAEKHPKIPKKYLDNGGREVFKRALDAVQNAVREGKAPLYSPMLRKDTIDNAPKTSDIFVFVSHFNHRLSMRSCRAQMVLVGVRAPHLEGPPAQMQAHCICANTVRRPFTCA